MVDVIGYLAGFFLMLSFIPQVIKTIKTRTTDGLSVAMLAITLISGVLYEIYSVWLMLTPVVVMNGIFTILVATQLTMTIKINAGKSRENSA